jgi:hypothetical protein
MQMLLSVLPSTQLLRDFEVLNYSPAVLRALAGDESLNARVQELIAMASQMALGALTAERGTGPLVVLYNRKLHEWLKTLAGDVISAAELCGEIAEDLHKAVDRLIERGVGFIDAPFSVIVDELMQPESDSNLQSDPTA